MQKFGPFMDNGHGLDSSILRQLESKNLSLIYQLQNFIDYRIIDHRYKVSNEKYHLFAFDTYKA